MKSNKSTYRYLLIPFSVSSKAGDAVRHCTRVEPMPQEIIDAFNGVIVFLGKDGKLLAGHMHTVGVKDGEVELTPQGNFTIEGNGREMMAGGRS